MSPPLTFPAPKLQGAPFYNCGLLASNTNPDAWEMFLKCLLNEWMNPYETRFTYFSKHFGWLYLQSFNNHFWRKKTLPLPAKSVWCVRKWGRGLAKITNTIASGEIIRQPWARVGGVIWGLEKTKGEKEKPAGWDGEEGCEKLDPCAATAAWRAWWKL